MLATNSTALKGTETFDEAFELIPDRSENVLVRPLYAKEGNDFSEVVIHKSLMILVQPGSLHLSLRPIKMGK